jgi:GT2 family glycosyltransferase
MDLSILVPHRGNPLGLWATLHSCEEELRSSKHSYEYVVVTNGGSLDVTEKQLIRNMEMTGKIRHLHYDTALTPPVARQRGAEIASGEKLFFFDNHCLVGKQYFDRAVAYLNQNGVDMLHSTTVFNAGDGCHYHYKLRLAYNFWAEGTKCALEDLRAYRIAAAGHGGFAIHKSVWDAVDGYGPDHLFDGYGGEEMAFDLKLWRYGYSVWLDPKMVHYHFAGNRGYSRHFSDDYYTNLLVSANVIGGEKWLYKVFESFISKPHIRINAKKHMWDILETAYNRSAQYAREVDDRSTKSLDEVLQYFRLNQVAM